VHRQASARSERAKGLENFRDANVSSAAGHADRSLRRARGINGSYQWSRLVGSKHCARDQRERREGACEHCFRSEIPTRFPKAR
jgi:hypothetical protein